MRILGASEILRTSRMVIMFVAVSMMILVAAAAAAGDHDVAPVEKMVKLQQQQPEMAVVLDSAAATSIACSFSNASMVSLATCSSLDGQSSIDQLEICLPFLINQMATPSAQCCSAVANVSSVLPACFCKVTFYPPQLVNSTQQKRMPGLCNVATDLCQACPQYLVPRTNNVPDWSTSTPAGSSSSAQLASKEAEYKRTMTWLAVVLALTLAAIAASAIAFFLHRRWKAKKSTTAALAAKMQSGSSATTQPGSDF